MNWYEHHIGDYDKNTSHLTACEDGIYSRLIRRYYDKEAPLPADVAEVKRLARARTTEERKAVDAVLHEFFALQEDGWRHKTIDEEIAAYRAGEPEREAKKKNENTRLAKHRAERAELFAAINAAGEHKAWNTPMPELREVAARIQQREPATDLQKPATPPATATATPATATQPPPTTSQPPPTNLETNTPLTPQGGKRPRTKRRDEPAYTSAFLRFWAVWPSSQRKEAKGDCFVLWASMGCDAVLDTIVAHVEHLKAGPKWAENGGEFVPAPKTYLNQRRWEGFEPAASREPTGHSEVVL